MAAVPTFDELLSTIPPSNRRQLDSKIDSDIHLEELGKELVCWEGVRPYLGLSAAEEEAVKQDSFGVERKRVGVLRKWREKFGPYATYRNLAKSFYDAGRLELVEAVCNQLSILGLQHQSQETQPRRFKARLPILKDVVTELADYSGWYVLGIGLEVPKTTLDKIHTNYRNGFCTVKRCKIEVVESWLQNAGKPTWATLVAALKAIGRTQLAKKIAKKYGIAFDHLPVSKDIISTQLKGSPCTSEQYSMIMSLQSDTAVEDEQLSKVEEWEENVVGNIVRIEEELTQLREQMQFDEKYTSMILSGSRLLRVQLRKQEEQVRNLQQQNERLQQTEMLQVELKMNEQTLDAKRREVEQLKKASRESESKLAATYDEIRKLKMQIAHLQSRFDALAKMLEVVCCERESLKEALQKHDQEIDQRMLEFMSAKPSEQQEVEYYNVMVCAGRVEVKLRESEVEMLHHQLEVKRGQVDLLMKQVQTYEQKSLDAVKQSKDELGSSTYSYAYVRGGPTISAFERYFNEQKISQLTAENLQYKIRLAAEEAGTKQLQYRLNSLNLELKDLRRVQSKAEAWQNLYSPRQQQQHEVLSHPLPLQLPSNVVVPESAEQSDSSEHNPLTPLLPPKPKRELKDQREVQSNSESPYSSQQQQQLPRPVPKSAEQSDSSEHNPLTPPLPPKPHHLQRNKIPRPVDKYVQEGSYPSGYSHGCQSSLELDSRHLSSTSSRSLEGPPVHLDKHPSIDRKNLPHDRVVSRRTSSPNSSTLVDSDDLLFDELRSRSETSPDQDEDADTNSCPDDPNLITDTTELDTSPGPLRRCNTEPALSQTRKVTLPNTIANCQSSRGHYDRLAHPDDDMYIIDNEGYTLIELEATLSNKSNTTASCHPNRRDYDRSRLAHPDDDMYIIDNEGYTLIEPKVTLSNNSNTTASCQPNREDYDRLMDANTQ